ncbi:MAG: type II secretion system protein GspD [Selenomonadaceae bacterium]|nr:type II secretion system protein GspD [Selenomonadaceae bacterium]
MLKKILPLIASAIFFMPAQSSAAPMTLSVHDADLRATIMLVAKTGGLNVSVDDSVKGTISISVDNVEPFRLLEIISRTKSLQLIQEAGVYIMTASSVEVMQSYVFPIRYGDAETLRDAVIMSLDPDTERLPNSSTRIRNSDGSYTYRYTYRNDDDDYNDFENVKRKDRVYINPEVNALVLYGTPAEYERVKNLLATLDVELKQVSVEAKFLIVNKEETKNFGIDWIWSSTNRHFSANVENMTNSSDYTSIQIGRSFSSISDWNFAARINALVTNGKAKILSRPNVTTIQGREAVIYVGNTVPVEKTERSETLTTSSYEYRDAGIKLKYIPHINVDGTITAKLYTEVSTPEYDKNTGAYQFNVRTAETTVTVRDGEPMVIGGLIGAEEEKSVSKIPFLGDLPILGALFRNHRKNKSESELIIFLTAHVLGGNSNEILSVKP